MKPKLIELINFLYQEEQRTGEVYMDKTLCEGCLIQFEVNGIITIDKFLIDMGVEFDCNFEKGINFETEFFKILGHLGLSSILKYIDNSYRDNRGIPHGDILIELSPRDIDIHINEEVYLVPNKEPHLMTDEELDNIITLIKELGK